MAVREKTIATPTTQLENPGTVVLLVRGKEIYFEPSSWVNPSCDFAIWAALPIAMRFGGELHINGSTSELSRRNAEKLSLIWSTWLPKKFQPVQVSSQGFPDVVPKVSDKSLMLFSGGVDSTFALKDWATNHDTKPDLITIHGMDYHRDDSERFKKLMAQTEACRGRYGNENFEVRSNAAAIMRKFGVSSAIGHGFQLFATLFLFDDSHDLGLIASDFTSQQDYLTIPWGTNSLTNQYFQGNRMGVRTLSLDKTRSQKIRALASDELALGSLSFCKNYNIRPRNCGTCSKCVRSKAMFHAAGVSVPDIFMIPEFEESDLRFLDLSKPSETAFAMDVLDMASSAGMTENFQALKERVFSPGHRAARFSSLRKLQSKLRTIIAKK